MVSFYSIILCCSIAASGVLSFPFEFNATELVERAGTPSQTGTSNGYYYSFWTNGGGTVNYLGQTAAISSLAKAGIQAVPARSPILALSNQVVMGTCQFMVGPQVPSLSTISWNLTVPTTLVLEQP
jgi:hypothetical protein